MSVIFVSYSSEFVITVIVITKFDCSSFFDQRFDLRNTPDIIFVPQSNTVITIAVITNSRMYQTNKIPLLWSQSYKTILVFKKSKLVLNYFMVHHTI